MDENTELVASVPVGCFVVREAFPIRLVSAVFYNSINLLLVFFDCHILLLFTFAVWQIFHIVDISYAKAYFILRSNISFLNRPHALIVASECRKDEPFCFFRAFVLLRTYYSLVVRFVNGEGYISRAVCYAPFTAYLTA